MRQNQDDFDDAQFDPLYCGAVVALVLARNRLGVPIHSLSFCQLRETQKEHESFHEEIDLLKPVSKFSEKSIDNLA